MSTMGQRKAALYLASLDAADQHALLSALPAEQARAIRPLIAVVRAKGWQGRDLVTRALSSEMRGLTAETSLSIEDFLTLTKLLPPDWMARLFAASAAIDTKFLLSLVDVSKARQVRGYLDEVQRMPSRLREALLIEAAELARTAS